MLGTDLMNLGPSAFQGHLLRVAPCVIEATTTVQMRSSVIL